MAKEQYNSPAKNLFVCVSVSVHCASLYSLSIPVCFIYFHFVVLARLDNISSCDLLRFSRQKCDTQSVICQWFLIGFQKSDHCRFMWRDDVQLTDSLNNCCAPFQEQSHRHREMHAAGTKESTTKCENKNYVREGREKEKDLALPFYSPYNKNHRNNSHSNKEYSNLFKCIKRIIHKNSTVRQTVTQIERKRIDRWAREGVWESNKNRKHKWMKEHHEWERTSLETICKDFFIVNLKCTLLKVYINHSCACVRLCGMCTFHLCDFTKCFSFPSPFIIFVFDSVFFTSILSIVLVFVPQWLMQFMLLIYRSTFCFYESLVVNVDISKHSYKFKVIIFKALENFIS